MYFNANTYKINNFLPIYDPLKVNLYLRMDCVASNIKKSVGMVKISWNVECAKYVSLQTAAYVSVNAPISKYFVTANGRPAAVYKVCLKNFKFE